MYNWNFIQNDRKEHWNSLFFSHKKVVSYLTNGRNKNLCHFEKKHQCLEFKNPLVVVAIYLTNIEIYKKTLQCYQ